MRELIKKYAYSGCLLWLLCVGVLTNMNTNFHLKVNEFFIMTITLIWIILLTVVVQNRKNPVTYVIIGLLVTIGSVLIKNSKIQIWKEFNGYQSWYYDVLSKSQKHRIIYSLITIIVLLVLISIVFQCLIRNFYLRVSIALLCLIAGVIGSITAVTVSKIGVISFLTYMTMCLVELVLLEQRKSKKPKAEPAMPFLLPFFLAFFLLLSVLPMKQTPIEWKFIRKCIANVMDTFENLSARIDLILHPEKEVFEMNFVGYSEDGGILGGLSESKTVAMRLETKYYVPNGIYLTGNVKNQFDGTTWKNSEDAEKMQSEYEDYVLDMAELYYAISRAGQMQEKYNLFQMKHIVIEYETLHTKSLFYPLKVTKFITKEKENQYNNSSSNMHFSDIHGNGTKYEVTYMNLNLESKEADDFICTEGNYKYQKAENENSIQFAEDVKTVDELRKRSITADFEAVLYERSKWIHENYLYVYPELPQRVRDLTNDITKDYPTDYEKLKAIENYLSGYAYTVTPQKTPSGEDMIDHLLFTSQEGYCTYYATAFAIMARCIGIPTRYVQGFSVSDPNKVSALEYEVENINAHAWPEAYIEGIGWIPFEPTPGYHYQRYQPWVYKKASDSEPEKVDNSEKLIEQREKMLEEKKEKNAYQNIIVTLIIVLLSIFSIVPLWLMIRIGYQKHVYKRSLNTQKIYINILQIMFIGSVCYRNIDQGETFCQYGTKLCKCINEIEPQWKATEKTFLEVRYHGQDPDEMSVKSIEKMKADMLLVAKEKLTKRKYLRFKLKFIRLDYPK